jgi:hypothetical protein
VTPPTMAHATAMFAVDGCEASSILDDFVTGVCDVTGK